MYQFALIGCGAAGRRHAAAIAQEHRLAIVCDIDKERADDLASIHKAHALYSIDELLENIRGIDVVVVCTPNGCHAEHSIKSLQAGCHVLCEAPLSLTGAAAWQMIETEKYCGRRLFVMHAAEGNSLMSSLKQRIGNNDEQLFSFELSCAAPVPQEDSWRRQSFPGGGALHGFFAGEIDLISYLFGPVAGASGKLSYEGELDISGTADLTMESGVRGSIAWALGDGKSRLTIRSFEQEIWSGDTEQFTGEADGLYDSYQQFIGVLAGEDRSRLFAATRTVEAIEKIYQSLSSNTATAR